MKKQYYLSIEGKQVPVTEEVYRANQSQGKQYQIVIKECLWNSEAHCDRITYHRIPATKAEFDDFYRDINAYRKREQEHGRCVCPKRDRLLCNMDCLACRYCTAGDFSSLNDILEDSNGNTIEIVDTLVDDRPFIESLINDKELLERLFDALNEIDPTRSAICRLWADGMSERAIAKVLGIKRQSTVNYQRNRALEDLRELLKDLI